MIESQALGNDYYCTRRRMSNAEYWQKARAYCDSDHCSKYLSGNKSNVWIEKRVSPRETICPDCRHSLHISTLAPKEPHRNGGRHENS